MLDTDMLRLARTGKITAHCSFIATVGIKLLIGRMSMKKSYHNDFKQLKI